MIDSLISAVPLLLLVALVIVGAVSLYLGWLNRRAASRALERYSGANVLLTEKDVNLAEHLSSSNRSRGNGVLVLTNEELGFQSLDVASLTIPLPSIQRVELVHITVGGKPARPLMRVYYTNAAGEQDIAGWLVAGAPQWVREIEARKG